MEKTPTQGVWVSRTRRGGSRRCAVLPDTQRECLKRVSYISGHLEGVRRMIEEGQYCVDVLNQTYAIRRAIEKLERMLLDGHLHTCVVEGIKDGRQEQVVGELLELYTLASR